jgi:cobalt/nickel transport system permease protein
MAVILPYVSFAIYQVIGRGSDLGARRRIVGAALGGWAGLTTAALFAGLEFGLQPLIFHTSNGTPLYAPYPLVVTVPAMVIPHALVASVAEGLLTALVVAYLQRTNQPALAFSTEGIPAGDPSRHRSFRPLWIALLALVLAVPLGLLAPGTAWGEWNGQQLANHGLGFIPQGLSQMSNLWAAPMAGYTILSIHNPTVGYILSAVLGVFLITFLAWLLASAFARSQPSG